MQKRKSRSSRWAAGRKPANPESALARYNAGKAENIVDVKEKKKIYIENAGIVRLKHYFQLFAASYSAVSSVNRCG